MTTHLNWGTGIAAVYVAFALATSGFVYFAMRQPVDLVRPDYYAASLTHDDRLAAIRRADGLGDAISVAVDAEVRAIAIAFPPAHLESMAGTITLYRAADASADRQMQMAPDRQGRQHVPLAGLARGHWLVKLEWRASGQRFYTERLVVVP